MNFDSWKELLRHDCIAHDKALEFDTLGESVLRILHENGLEPNVEAIARDGINGNVSALKPER